MFERCLNEVELILGAHKDPLVPVKEVWEEVVRRSKIENFEVASLEDFTAMLEADSRFQIVPARSEDEKDIEMQNETDNEMGSLGFYPEDRVRLRMAKLLTDDLEEKDEVQTSDFNEIPVVKKKLIRGNTPKKKITKRKIVKIKKIRKMKKQRKVKVNRKNKNKKRTRK